LPVRGNLHGNVKSIVLLPIGAVVVPGARLRGQPMAFVAAMGPIAGMSLALLFGGLYLACRLPILAAAAVQVVIFNFVNMLPVPFLDGYKVGWNLVFEGRDHLKFGPSIVRWMAIFAWIGPATSFLLYGFHRIPGNREAMELLMRGWGR